MDKFEILILFLASLNIIVLLLHQNITLRHLTPMSYYILPDIRRYEEYKRLTTKISSGELCISALHKYVHDSSVHISNVMKVMGFYLDADTVITYIPLKDKISLQNSTGHWTYEIVIREVLVVRNMPTEKQFKQLKDYLPVMTLIDPKTRTVIWQ